MRFLLVPVLALCGDYGGCGGGGGGYDGMLVYAAPVPCEEDADCGDGVCEHPPLIGCGERLPGTCAQVHTCYLQYSGPSCACDGNVYDDSCAAEQVGGGVAPPEVCGQDPGGELVIADG